MTIGIGTIISTVQGLAVVVGNLPLRFTDGNQQLSQVIAAPLTGGGPPFTPIAEEGTVTAIINQLIAEQAAAEFVTSVIDSPLPFIDLPVVTEPGTFTGGPPPPEPQLEPLTEAQATAAALVTMKRAIDSAAALAIQRTRHVVSFG